MPSFRPNASNDLKQAAIDEGKKVLFLRQYEGCNSKAWDVSRKNFKSFEGPRLQKLNSDLRTLKKNRNETVIDCLTRAEEIQ